MAWLLVFITYWDGQIMTVGNGVFETHTECFIAREQLSADIGIGFGHFPVNQQAICMRIEVKDDNR